MVGKYKVIKLDFMQMTPVPDKDKPRKLVAFFVDES